LANTTLEILTKCISNSPFFEYYQDDLAPLFLSKQHYVLDFNFKCFDIILECLQLDLNYNTTTTYQKEVTEQNDLRYLVNARKEKEILFQPYTQVFGSKHGFINNLGILDLLFNEGTNALNYLQSQKLIS